MVLRPQVSRTEARHPLSVGLHSLAADAALTVLLDAQIAALSAVRPAIPAIDRAARAVAAALRGSGRVIYAGAGSSGLMALSDCLELAGTFGIPTDRTSVLLAGGEATLLDMAGGVEDDADAARRDFDRLSPCPADVLVCLAASGGTPYTVALARLGRAAGLCVIGVANAPACPLLEAADIPILLDTGPEVVTGSTRMGAATAQKVALNMMSTRVGLLLGHVHDGHMVNLRADNAKLRDRAVRIVADIAGCDPDTARAALTATDGAVKPAVLVAAGAPPDAAADLVTRSGGVLRDALRQITTKTNHREKA